MNDLVQTQLDIYQSKQFLTERDIYTDFVQTIMTATSSDVGYLHLYDSATQEIVLNVWSKSVIEKCTTIHDNHYPLASAGIWAECIRTGKPAIHNGYPEHPASKGLPEGHFHLESHISVPVIENGKVIAVIGQGNAPHPYTDDDADLTLTFITEGWHMLKTKVQDLHSAQRHKVKIFGIQDAKPLMLAMLGAISRAVELKDEYTSHHQINTASIAVAIAHQMGLSENFIFGLELGAIVHDIGKISIPTQILNKASPLSQAEFNLIKEHSASGSQIFRHIDSPWPIQEMIRQHHERLDGSGYPDGLLGSNMICLEARILAVADTFDAMTSDRPYRRAPGITKTIQTLSNGRGTLYDAGAVDALLQLMENGENLFKNRDISKIRI